MKEIEITSLSDYVDKICKLKYDSQIFYNIYRGQIKDEPLLPKIVRNNILKKEEILGMEEKMLDGFKLKARPYLDFDPENNLE